MVKLTIPQNDEPPLSSDHIMNKVAMNDNKQEEGGDQSQHYSTNTQTYSPLNNDKEAQEETISALMSLANAAATSAKNNSLSNDYDTTTSSDNDREDSNDNKLSAAEALATIKDATTNSNLQVNPDPAKP